MSPNIPDCIQKIINNAPAGSHARALHDWFEEQKAKDPSFTIHVPATRFGTAMAIYSMTDAQLTAYVENQCQDFLGLVSSQKLQGQKLI